jgi:queuosine precursor transporter
MIGPLAVPAGVLVFPLAYILNDVITEVWGYSKARLIIWAGFAVNLLMVFIFSLTLAVPAAPFWEGQEAFSAVLGSTPRIVAASLLAYLLGSFLNAWIMSRFKVKTKGKGFSLRAVLSTVIGEGADSVIFISVAFAGLFPSGALLTMMATQAMVKIAFEVVVLPLTVAVVNKIKKLEGTEAFDHKISYNPFRLKEI